MLIAYTLPAINPGLQAPARVIRAESERGVLVFCDRRFGGASGGVNQFLPQWVREEIIAVDAQKGRELILAKTAEWGSQKIQEKRANEKAVGRKRSVRGMAGKCDLTVLVAKVGLGRSVVDGQEQRRSAKSGRGQEGRRDGFKEE
ncbi:Uncharacterised protein [uncultured archaeon]|nr:Uncharacterised protein [uncultured archaeon]